MSDAAVGVFSFMESPRAKPECCGPDGADAGRAERIFEVEVPGSTKRKPAVMNDLGGEDLGRAVVFFGITWLFCDSSLL